MQTMLYARWVYMKDIFPFLDKYMSMIVCQVNAWVGDLMSTPQKYLVKHAVRMMTIE